MWFDEIMDDCKQALLTANKHKSIFMPIFLKLGLSIAIFGYIMVSIVTGIIRHEYVIEYMFTDYYALMEVLPTILINGTIIYLLVLAGFSILDVGSLNMLKAALRDEKPRFRDFVEGVKSYLLKVMLGKFVIHLVTLVLLPLIAALYLLYILVAGTLTAGWAVVFLSVYLSIYLSTWTAITVIEGYSPFKAIGRGFRLGSRHFKGLFIVLLAAALISSYSTSIFGVLAAVLAGWFIAGVAATYFKLVVMLIYYRNRENL